MWLFVAGILVLLWLLGFLGHIAGNLIHIILLVAIIVFVYHLLTHNRSVE